MTFSVLINTHCSLAGSEELRFGLRNLQGLCRASAGFMGWHAFDTREGLAGAHALLGTADGEHVVVILNPALVTTNGFLACLERVVTQFPQRVVVAADPRSAQGAWQIDYASRAGLERYVARRQALAPYAEAEPLSPWAFMARKETLLGLIDGPAVRDWEDVATAVRNDALVAQHAFVHSFADYAASERRDMLDLVPADVLRLADVGGGEGWFLSAFQAERPQGRGILIEPHTAAAALAQARGLEVANTRFESVSGQTCGAVDGISFLDVLEHLEDPLSALLHARTLLGPQGYVLLSVPNVGHWSVVEDLLEGQFDYLPLGILCCTHLRFFTERSLRELLTDAGFDVRTWRNQPSPMPQRMRAALQAAQAQWPALDWGSLETDSFHVVAQVSGPKPTGVQ